MKRLLLLLSICCSPLFAEKIDPSATSYGTTENKRIETYDFSGEYAQLESIVIDAKKKMRVALVVNGVYPALKKFQYTGSFGCVTGKMGGVFPELKKMDFACGSSSVTLDFTGSWKNDCEINIQNNFGDIELILPQDVALTFSTKTGPACKVKVPDYLTKKRALNWMNRVYYNESGKQFVIKTEKTSEKKPIHLHFNLQIKEGTITLN